MNDDKDNIQLSTVEDHDGILIAGAARTVAAAPAGIWNGIHYKQALELLPTRLALRREVPSFECI
jgi:hypothetical protein